MNNKNLFGAPFRAPGRDPEGRPLSDYCLADNRAIVCTAGRDTMLPFARYLAQVLIPDNDFEVDQWRAQPEIGLVVDGKRVRLDLVIAGTDGRLLDVEPQTSRDRALLDRMTAYTAFLVADQLSAGEDFTELRDVYVVFVCKGDPLSRGRAIETMEMTYESDRSPCAAKVHWTVLSFAHLKEPESEAEWLLHDFFCKDVAEMHSPAMSNRLKYLRSEEGSTMMFETREEEVRRKAEEAKREGLIEGKAEGRIEGKAEGRIEGLAEGRIEGLAEGLTKGKAEGILEERERAVLGMLRDGMPLEKVAAYTSLAIEDVRDIARRNGIELS